MRIKEGGDAKNLSFQRKSFLVNASDVKKLLGGDKSKKKTEKLLYCIIKK